MVTKADVHFAPYLAGAISVAGYPSEPAARLPMGTILETDTAPAAWVRRVSGEEAIAKRETAR